jgi:transketolase
VGFALAEHMLATRFNRETYRPIEHYTYVFCRDADMVKGICHEGFFVHMAGTEMGRSFHEAGEGVGSCTLVATVDF